MQKNSEQILTEYLVINCQLGESAAMEQLLAIWYPKLLRYAHRQLGDAQKAQDAVQMTLEVVSRSIGKLKEPSAFAKWIYQILQRKSVDLIRAKQKHQALCADFLLQMNAESDFATAKPSQQQGFDELLLGLPDDLYQLVHLHYLEGFTQQEIAELLAIPTGTVKSRLFQARKLIRNNSN